MSQNASFPGSVSKRLLERPRMRTSVVAVNEDRHRRVGGTANAIVIDHL
jgi:hypothetical protein